MDLADILLRARTNAITAMSLPGKQSGSPQPAQNAHSHQREAQSTPLRQRPHSYGPQAQDMLATPRLHPLQHTQIGPKGILRGSPKRKRRDSQEEIGMSRGFEPQLSQELEKARNFAEINSHLKGDRFSPMVLVTPKPADLDTSRPLGSNTALSIGGASEMRRAGLDEVDEGASSPRTAVAKKLGKLDLQPPTLGNVPILRFGGQSEEKDRKKIRLEGFEDVSSSNASTHAHEEESGDGFSPRRAGGGISWHHSLSFREKSDDGRVMEIPETPQPPAPSSHRGSPPPLMVSPSRLATILPATTFQPPESSSFSSTSSPSLNEMTWQDSEITGHLALDPDDDGYGVNGIGFRPTPAIAYARSQRRRQQVLEWKNRESREARSRRAEERRRGMKIGSGGAESEKERAVRFLD